MRVLFVDDEPRILQGLRRSLFDLGDGWEVLCAEGATPALQILEAQPIDVLVTDMRMPRVHGVELLAQVKERFPGAIRVVLSGATDEDSAIRSVGLAHQYLSKPFEPELLLRLIEQTEALNQLLASSELRSRVQSLSALPPVPRVYHALSQALLDPDTDIRQIAKIVMQDPAICAKLLQLVNSSFFARRVETTDLVTATMHLGMDTIRNLVLGLEVFESASKLARGLGSYLDALQLRSLRLGRLCELVAAGTPYVKESFLLGMVLDIGQLVLAATHGKRWLELNAQSGQDGQVLIAAEREAFSVTHAEIGAYLLGIWGLPFHIVEGVAYHHELARGARRGLSPPSIGALATALLDSVPPPKDWLQTVGVHDRYDEYQLSANP